MTKDSKIVTPTPEEAKDFGKMPKRSEVTVLGPDEPLEVPEVEVISEGEETEPKKIGWKIRVRKGATIYKFVGDVDWEAYNREVRLKGKKGASWPPPGLEAAKGRSSLKEGDRVLIQGFGVYEATVRGEADRSLYAYTEGEKTGFSIEFEDEYDEWVSTGQFNLEAIRRRVRFTLDKEEVDK